MKIPQTILLVLLAIELLISANQHGQPKNGKISFWETLIGALILISILNWGGFFK